PPFWSFVIRYYFVISHSDFVITRMSLTYLEAIREAQARLLRDDDRVFIYGQDVGGTFGGACKATKGLAKEFPGRVLNTPISEDAIVGTAIGAAMQGMRPIVEDAYTMLIEAVAIDDPVVYCEHKYLYYHLKAEKLPDRGLPTGRARIAREGRDLTIVSYSAMTQESLAAAEELSREGLEVEVLDLRTVKPLDIDTVLASVARTVRLLGFAESL